MLGPIDYVIVGFEGNKFDGSVLNALGDALDSGVINVLALSLIVKDDSGVVTTLDMTDLGDEYITQFSEKYSITSKNVTDDDIEEVGDLLKPNTAAGLLIIEQVWAKPLKEALIKASRHLIAEGRIHPEAAEELNA